MNRSFGRSYIFSNPYNKYNDGPCINKYHTIKKDIEKKIDAFNKISRRNVSTEWDALYRHIMTKDQELKECYESGYKKTCKDHGGCKKETSATDNVKSQSRLISGASDSKSSERRYSQEQGKNSADGQNLRQESVIPQSDSGSASSVGPVITNGKTYQEIVDHHSRTSEMVEAQARQLNASSPSGIRGLDSSTSDPTSECVSGKISGLTCTSKVQNLDIKDIQNNQHRDNPLDTNNLESQDSAGKVVEGKTSDVQAVFKGGSDGLPPTNMNSGSGLLSGEYSLRSSTNGVGNDTVASGSVNTDSSEVSIAAPSVVPSRDVGTKIITFVDLPPYKRTSGSESNSAQFARTKGNVDEFTNVGHTDSQYAPFIGSQVHVPNLTTSCREGATSAENDNGSACSAEKVGELTDDTLDIYGKVISAIKDNPQIIKTSMPIGIAMLLGLLLKVN
ncbi:hypothetical protein PVBG_05890 [Plasmodium vivax Brazil I]|uniref:Variable surface protein Vir18 n=1 Tax=Plasmodium vivax (strain Brazil I) TaxID=1033975 RepID=A0A0J9VAX9_PLAV1|nr:hypothetical protein PVBG_05890 [Plasmodium vivax Brazil I]